MLLPVNGKLEIRPKFGAYLQDLRLILKKRLLYLIGFAANTGNSSSLHTFKEERIINSRYYNVYLTILLICYIKWDSIFLFLMSHGILAPNVGILKLLTIEFT